MNSIKCDGIIVDYCFNGKWKHKQLTIERQYPFSMLDMSTSDIVQAICLDDKQHEITPDNIACFLRVFNWDKGLEELVKISDSEIAFTESLKGYTIMLAVVNEKLYVEWLKPEKYM